MAFSILGNEDIIDQSHTMIIGSEGLGEELMKDIERLIGETNVPDTKLGHQCVFPGFMQSLLGGGRTFLVIRNTKNPNVKPYKMYVNARDYGINLQVSWFLVIKPGFWLRLVHLLLRIPVVGLVVFPFFAVGKLAQSRRAGVTGFNVFDMQDAMAYVDNCKRCVDDAVDKLCKARNVEAAVIDRNLGGFLGVG